MTTGQRIKAARKKAGLTQKELGAKLGIAYQTLAQWENDLRNPKMETINKIADALGINAFFLYDEDLQAVIDEADKWEKEHREELTTEEQAAAEIIKRVKEGIAGTSFRKMTDSEAEKAGFLQFNSDEDRLAYFYSKLNDYGKRVAAARVQELTEIPKYQAQKPPETEE